MAKKELGVKNTLGLSPKLNLKTPSVDVVKTDISVENIHKNMSSASRTIRLSVDITEDIYEKFQLKLLSEKKQRKTKKLTGQQLIRELLLNYLTE